MPTTENVLVWLVSFVCWYPLVRLKWLAKITSSLEANPIPTKESNRDIKWYRPNFSPRIILANKKVNIGKAIKIIVTLVRLIYCRARNLNHKLVAPNRPRIRIQNLNDQFGGPNQPWLDSIFIGMVSRNIPVSKQTVFSLIDRYPSLHYCAVLQIVQSCFVWKYCDN